MLFRSLRYVGTTSSDHPVDRWYKADRRVEI
jgi:hypothetical protein